MAVEVPRRRRVRQGVPTRRPEGHQAGPASRPSASPASSAALGLIEGPVDLIESDRDLGATNTVGFYDQERKELFVRGTDLTDVDVRITFVHELTHALQDQRFDLTKLDDTVETEGEDFALTALVEGDATERRGRLPVLVAPGRAGRVLRRGARRHHDRRARRASSSDIPPVLDLFTSGPYIFGSRYIELLREAGGEGTGRPTRSRPRRSPRRRSSIRSRPAAAPQASAWRRRSWPPTSSATAKPNEFGALSLYLVLASRLDPELTLHAAEGWGGDRYVGFTKRAAKGQECVRIAIVGDTETDTAQLADGVFAVGCRAPNGCGDVGARRRSGASHRVRHRARPRLPARTPSTPRSPCSWTATTSRSNCSTRTPHRASPAVRPIGWPPIPRSSPSSTWTSSPRTSSSSSPI